MDPMIRFEQDKADARLSRAKAHHDELAQARGRIYPQTRGVLAEHDARIAAAQSELDAAQAARDALGGA